MPHEPTLPPLPADPRALYLDLLKRSLINWVYGREEGRFGRRSFGEIALSILRGNRGWSMRLSEFDPVARKAGLDWPAFAHSMVGWERLSHLQRCAETVLAEKVPGDFLEAGVWRGGAAILLRGVLKANAVVERTVWVADSFQGLPASGASQDKGLFLHRCEDLAVSRADVEENFRRYGLLDSQVRFAEGWFADSLPALPVGPLAILRVDADLYSSTTDVLVNLYDRVSPDGFVIIDDYHRMQSCKQAVDDFRAARGITEPLQDIDDDAVCWRKAR